ncbi:hypothetical protein [Nocardioides sp.]|uniref:hypothetical protein n=1 Tax=Nocardioides sp. TaxID=35761 RepID=UPI001A2A10B3|nr:hypothetical protein [Nocardioides sp.]MBJ7356492.1 hypothetical protein [Nocardioides sp.]
MPAADDLEDPETWLGGFYGLAVLLGPRDDDVLTEAGTALWRLAGFDRGAPPGRATLTGSLVSRGVVEPLPGRPVAAMVSVLRVVESAEPDEDWLFLDIPLGALEAWDPAVGAFPFGPEASWPSRAWREPLEGWLVAVARALFAEVPYLRASTGWEASGLVRSDDLTGGGHHALLLNDGGRLQVSPVSRWDFGMPG